MVDAWEWVECRNFQVPDDCIKCGSDKDGSDIYAGLSEYGGDVLPTKVVPKRNEAYISYAGKEHKVNVFQAMCKRTLQWVPSSNGELPPNAIEGGLTFVGAPLYIGRVKVNNATLVGKVDPENKCLYVLYDGKEVSFKNYEVLVLKR